MARNADLEFRIDASVTGLPAVQQTQQRMKSLETQMNRSKYAVNQFGGALTGAEAKSRKFAMGALQQAGYQVGDYAVQVANGTSAMQAFGQQGSQLLGIFGPVGALLGAGVAIFSAFAVAAERAGKQTKSLAEATDDLDKSANSAFSAMEALTLPTEQAIEKYGELTELMRELARIESDITFSKFARDLTAAQDAISEITDTGFFERLGMYRLSFAQNIGASLDKLADDFAISTGQAMNLMHAIRNFEQAEGVEAVGEQAKELLDFLGLLRPTTEDGAAALNDLQDYLLGVAQASLKYQVQTTKTADGVRAIATHYDDVIGSADGLKQAEEALNQLYEARIGTIDTTASGYVDILGSEAGLQAAMSAANSLYEARLGTIDDTANEYVDILGSEAGLAAAVAATNKLFQDRLGTIDKTANEYVDILGSAEGLAAANDALNDLYQDGLDAAERAAKIPDPLGDLVKRTQLEMLLTGELEARADVMRAIFSSERQYTQQQIDDATLLLSKYQEQQRELEKMSDIGDMVGNSFEGAFMSMIDGTKTAEQAFKGMAREVISELYRILVVKKITGFISNFASDPAMFGGMLGGGQSASMAPPLRSFAGGGYTGSGSRSGGLDGKGGYMAMIHPRERVVDLTKDSSQGVTIVQNNTFGDGVSRGEINAMLPKIVETTKAAVFDAQRRSVTGRGY